MGFWLQGLRQEAVLNTTESYQCGKWHTCKCIDKSVVDGNYSFKNKARGILLRDVSQQW
ncbi:MAG: hypothetical protein ACLVB1_10385 [Blautia obeum]